MTRRVPALPVAAAAAAVAFAASGVTTACTPEKAVDCARFSVRILSSFDAVEEAVTTSFVEDDLTAFEELRQDVEELESRFRDVDVRRAAESVTEAAGNVQQTAENGEEPDLAPLQEAMDELHGVCVPSETG